MRLERIIGRTIGKQQLKSQKKAYQDHIQRGLHEKSYMRGVNDALTKLEHSTDQLSYEVEVGGIHG